MSPDWTKHPSGCLYHTEKQTHTSYHMKNRVNYPFLAFLAWMAALMVMVVLQGCTTYDTHTKYANPVGNTECAAYY